MSRAQGLPAELVNIGAPGSLPLQCAAKNFDVLSSSDILRSFPALPHFGEIEKPMSEGKLVRVCS